MILQTGNNLSCFHTKMFSVKTSFTFRWCSSVVVRAAESAALLAASYSARTTCETARIILRPSPLKRAPLSYMLYNRRWIFVSRGRCCVLAVFSLDTTEAPIRLIRLSDRLLSPRTYAVIASSSIHSGYDRSSEFSRPILHVQKNN